MEKRTEREFLHDLSSPLGALQLHLEHMADLFRKDSPQHPLLARVEKAVSLIQKTNLLVTERREELK